MHSFKEKSPIEIVDLLLTGHLASYPIRNIWEGLVLSEQGLARMASVLGLIRGLQLAGKEQEASTYATGLFNAMETLNRTEEVEAENGIPYLKTITVLFDDGSFNNFAFNRYRFTSSNEFKSLQDRVSKTGARTPSVLPPELSPYPASTPATYVFDGNGGVIYRGPGMCEPFSVSADDNPPLWSIHT